MTSRDVPLRVWPGVVAFLGWGATLAFFQWAVERSAGAVWVTERLTAAVSRAVSAALDVPIHLDGTVLEIKGVSQEVAPACLGLAAVTVILAALLATPAGWRERFKGLGLAVGAIVLANVVRLALLTLVFIYASGALAFVHLPMWGTVVPFFLVAVWGLWLVRDLHYLPRFPLKLLGRGLLFLGLLFAAWYVVLDRYLVALVLTVNVVLSGLAGVPIETVRLTAADLYRYLDVGLPRGGFRLELAGQTLSFVPCLALILASPIAIGRRLMLSVYGVAALFAFNVIVTSVLIFLAWSVPGLVPVFQIVNDFLSLAIGPTVWLVLVRPSLDWFGAQASLPRIPRSARNFA